jgi:hypothetical protein
MTREEIEQAYADEGLSPHSWSNRADYFYEAHSHDYDKVLYCVQGEVTFHMSDGDVVLHPGQRVDIPAGARHAATVGPHGVECMEAPKYRRGWIPVDPADGDGVKSGGAGRSIIAMKPLGIVAGAGRAHTVESSELFDGIGEPWLVSDRGAWNGSVVAASMLHSATSAKRHRSGEWVGSPPLVGWPADDIQWIPG